MVSHNDDWQIARVTNVVQQTPTVKTFWLATPKRWPIRLGQALQLRLTGAAGEIAQRQYWLASSPLEPGLAITVQKHADGAVSSYLDSFLQIGDELEMNLAPSSSPSWSETDPTPTLLLAAQLGIVPLGAMLRHHQLAAACSPMQLIYTPASTEEVIYKEWLAHSQTSTNGREVHIHTTSSLSNETLDAMIPQLNRGQLAVYVAGPKLAAQQLASTAQKLLAIPPDNIKLLTY